MVYYVFDGSFEGLFTAIYDAYYCRIKPEGIYDARNIQQSILDRYINIETSHEKFRRVYNYIAQKISSRVLKDIYRVYLSEEYDYANIIYKYIKLIIRQGSSSVDNLTDDTVFLINKISRRVGFEKHRLLGFVRFSLLKGGVYYAPIEPDYNITILLAPHFASRLSDQNWIIHDTNREIAAVYDGTDFIITAMKKDSVPNPEEDEIKTRDLWVDFFKSICIRERTNSKLQKRMMPVRYWNNLTEKNWRAHQESNPKPFDP